VEAILSRRHPASLIAPVAYFHRLEEPVQNRVVAVVDRLYAALRDARGLEDVQARLNAIEIILRSKEYRLAYLIASLLRDRSPRVRETAAAAMRTLTATFLDEWDAFTDKQTSIAPNRTAEVAALEAEAKTWIEDRRQLVEAVATGLEWFDTHLHAPVVEAALWLVDDLAPRLWESMADRTCRSRRAAIELLMRSFSPRMSAFALEAIAHEGFRPIVFRRLRSEMSMETLKECLRQSWRLAAEPQQSHLKLLKQWPKLAAAFEQMSTMTPVQQMQAIRVLMGTGLPGETKLRLLLRAYQQCEHAGQRAAVWALCQIEESEATTHLRAVERDGDKALAAIARRELKHRAHQASVADAKAQAEGSPAMSELERLWRAFEAMAPADQEHMAYEVLAKPENLSALAHHKLASADATTRIKAMQLLSLTRNISAVEESIYGLAHDPDPRVRSAVMSALTQLPTATTERLLRQALNDTNDRVRANAIETMEHLGLGKDEALLRAKLHDPDNRTRANAIKALLKLGVRESAERLVAMLQDPDRDHRISALWAVSTLQLTPMIERLRDMAQNDPDRMVRQRAKEILRALAQGPGQAAPAHKEALPSTR
jgi:HEAT repeat protein